MKNLKRIVFVLMLTIIFTSCGSSDDPTEGEGTFTAKVAGTNFSSLKASVSAVVTSGILQVQGSDANGNYIRVSISSYNGTGTYTTGNALSNTNSLMYGTINPVASWMSTFDIGSGTITITEDDDNHVKGTFSFTGYNASDRTNKQITDGIFNAPKQ